MAGWTCPEDRTQLDGFTIEAATAAVRAHFEMQPHKYIDLAGFTDSGPVIAGYVPPQAKHAAQQAREEG